MTGGWVKLYRSLTDDPIWLNSTTAQKAVLIALLTMANHAENKWEWQGKPFVCKPGQIITSLKSIKKKCGKGVSIRMVQIALERFEKLGFLSYRPSKTGSIVTICNWEAYQHLEMSEVKGDVKDTLNISQSDVKDTLTNKNVKNEKKVKKDIPSSFSSNKFLSFSEMDTLRAQQRMRKAMEEFENENMERI
jgi:DNA replication protein DnaD